MEHYRGKKRFVGFDILKFICAFLVVCIHTPFPGDAAAYFTALTRIAVPIFFMITGYYYCEMLESGKVAGQIKKILLLVIEANSLYLTWKCFYAVASGNGLAQYIEVTFTVENIAKFLVLNESLFYGHLWYLGAILYVLIIAEVARKKIRGGVLENNTLYFNPNTFECGFAAWEIFDFAMET